jgi:hypothetical protein
MVDLSKQRDYVRGLDLKGTRRGMIAQDAAAEAGDVFDKAKAQAQVVGSGVFSFTKGVDESVREAISDSALLAQLVADKKYAVEDDPIGWARQYAEVLKNVGWTMQEGGWNDYSTSGSAAEVNEKIVEIMTVVLGPGATALAIIASTIEALKSMSPDSPWLTIFSRESQKAKMARFQIGLVDTSADGDVFVSMVVCLIEAKNDITQVLVFKFRDSHASFKASSAKVSLNRQALTDLSPVIRAKVRAYQLDYVSGVFDV